MYSKRHYQSSVQSFTRAKPNHQGKKFFQAFIHFVNNAISWKNNTWKIFTIAYFLPYKQMHLSLGQAFFLTPLGRVGEDKSSETLSFFLEFWVFSLSFEFFSWVFGKILFRFPKNLKILTISLQIFRYFCVFENIC